MWHSFERFVVTGIAKHACKPSACLALCVAGGRNLRTWSSLSLQPLLSCWKGLSPLCCLSLYPRSPSLSWKGRRSYLHSCAYVQQHWLHWQARQYLWRELTCATVGSFEDNSYFATPYARTVVQTRRNPKQKVHTDGVLPHLRRQLTSKIGAIILASIRLSHVTPMLSWISKKGEPKMTPYNLSSVLLSRKVLMTMQPIELP